MGNAPGPNPSGVEVELKLRLPDEAALERVARAAGGSAGRAVRQVNHFFDARDRSLDRGKFIMRLREEDGRFFLTAKGPRRASADGLLSSGGEAEAEIDALLAARVLAGAASPLDALAMAAPPAARPVVEDLRAALAGRTLERVGAFENERRRLDARLPGCDSPLTLELDRTRFPGGVTHVEIEVELPAGVDPRAAQTAVEALLARAGVRGTPSPSKSKRFFLALAGEPI